MTQADAVCDVANPKDSYLQQIYHFPFIVLINIFFFSRSHWWLWCVCLPLLSLSFFIFKQQRIRHQVDTHTHTHEAVHLQWRTNVRFNSSVRSTYSIIWNNLANKLISSHRHRKIDGGNRNGTHTHSLAQGDREIGKTKQKILVNRKQFICCWQRQSTSTLKYTEKRLHILINIVASRALCVCVSATRRTPSTTHISISLKRRFRDILRHQLNLEITQSSSSSLYSIHFIRNNFKPQEDKRK